jgi:hypothetical protein
MTDRYAEEPVPPAPLSPTEEDALALAIGRVWVRLRVAERRRNLLLRDAKADPAERSRAIADVQMAYNDWLDARGLA